MAEFPDKHDVPTPVTDSLRTGIKARGRHRGFCMPEDVEDALTLCERLERELAERRSQCDHVERENETLREVMVAAAEELAAHWEAHCDAEGYGPANLERRLNECLAVSYPGYSMGEFARMQRELAEKQKTIDGWVAANAPGGWIDYLRTKRSALANSVLNEMDGRGEGDEGLVVTDDVRAALLFALWHHQGGSSRIGQPLRLMLGVGSAEPLRADQIAEAKRVESALAPSATPDRSAIIQAAARGWCSPANQHKEMDAELAAAIADEIMSALKNNAAPQGTGESDRVKESAIPAVAAPFIERRKGERRQKTAFVTSIGPIEIGGNRTLGSDRRKAE